MPASVPTRHWLIVLALCCAALAQTLGYYALLRDDPGNYNGTGAFGDQVAYIELSQQILRGQWEGAVHYMPGYPAVLALATLLFGEPRLGVALLQALLHVGMVVGAFVIGRDAFSARAGLIGAALMALNPAMGFNAGQALTEFVTAGLLFGIAAALYAWSRGGQRLRFVVLTGVLVAAAGYVRSEYLALAALLALAVLASARGRGLGARHAATLLVVAAVCVLPWLVRGWAATGRPTLYNVSPFTNLMLMGTWFRVFDERTFAELQEIDQSSRGREEAIDRASRVGPRPDLSARYMSQLRGPYELPLDQTLRLTLENIGANPRQYAINHLVLAPVLIWAGRTPLRQADAALLPASLRYALWGAQLALFVLGVWQCVRAARAPRTRLLGLTGLAVFAFLTGVHVFIGVDERFTAPALPLVHLFAGGSLAWLVGLLPARREAAPSAEPARA